MRILILGAGLMARGAAFDYLRNPAVTSLVVADVSEQALEEIERRFPDTRLRTVTFDARDGRQLADLMCDADAAFSAIHYGFNVEFTEAAIAAHTHMVDLGGNNAVVTAQLGLTEDAQLAGVSIIPDCGLAPGMASILVAWGLKRFDWADTVRMRVGGLPLEPQQPFQYERLFSVEGLINEYVETPVLLRDGQLIEVEPLGDVETIDFGPLIGKLEAFNTSGGVSTLPRSFRTRVKNLDYKTLRYPGHAAAMRWLLHLGMFSSEPVSVDNAQVIPRRMIGDRIVDSVPLCRRDRTVVRIEFAGQTDGGSRAHRLDIVDEYDPDTDLTSMMRMTAFPAAIISQMQCAGHIASPGVIPQELAVDPDVFVTELTRRGIKIKGI